MAELNTIKKLPPAAAESLSITDALEIEQDGSGSVTLGALLAFLVANFKVTRADGSAVELQDVLAALDPGSAGFQAAFNALFKAYLAGLPKDQGTGVAPVPAGEVFSNNGTPQLAQ